MNSTSSFLSVMSKPQKPLHASTAKIKNADIKFRELMGLINQFTAVSNIRMRKEIFDGQNYFIGSVHKDMPDEIPLKVGEVAVQLRDALDKMAVALALLNGKGGSGVGFPWGGMDPKTGQIQPFPTSRHDTLRKKLTPDQWDLIIAQKPHPGGNDLLWAINQISNNDKHWEGLVDTKITPSINKLDMTEGYIDSIELVAGAGAGQIEWPSGLARKHETERVLVITGPKTTVRINANVTASVVFRDIVPISGKEVLTTLNQQIRLTEGIVKIFGSAFF